MLDPSTIQLCHRCAADAFASTEDQADFSSSVRLDPRFEGLDGRIQDAVLARAFSLRALWLAKGVSEPIKQNFLDDLSDLPVLNSEVDPNG